MRQSFKFCLSSYLSLVFISTTASSKVVNRASTVNVFSCKTLQFALHQNFISQIDRESIALSLEYPIFLMKAMYQEGIFAVEIGKIDGRDNADLEGNFEKIFKIQIEIF